MRRRSPAVTDLEMPIARRRARDLRADGVLADLTLPYPPSVNDQYSAAVMLRVPFEKVRSAVWRNAPAKQVLSLFRANVYLSSEGKKYREAVAAACLHERVTGALPEPPIFGELALRAVAYPPALKRTRDVHNLIKALFDAITYAGVIADDSQIVEPAIRWGQPQCKPSVRIVITRASMVPDSGYLFPDRA